MVNSINNIEFSVSDARLIRLSAFKYHDRGDIFVAEAKKHLPFEPRRVFFINNFTVPENIHGEHAHKLSRQVIFCANGSFILSLDDGKHKQDILMDDYSLGIYMGPKLWRVMKDFSKDCVILVMCDDHYLEEEYVRNYEDFIKLV